MLAPVAAQWVIFSQAVAARCPMLAGKRLAASGRAPERSGQLRWPGSRPAPLKSQGNLFHRRRISDTQTVEKSRHWFQTGNGLEIFLGGALAIGVKSVDCEWPRLARSKHLK
jgi:hypothetical protein